MGEHQQAVGGGQSTKRGTSGDVEGEIARLREDMRAGFESIHRLVTALGARWG